MPPAAEACYQKIIPTIHEWELRNLVRMAVNELRPHHVVELGTYLGGFAALFSHICTGRMISVDNFPMDLTLAKECGTDRLQFVTGSTSDPQLSLDIMSGLDRPLDMLFIDAGHLLADVTNDFNVWSPCVRKGGWIVFHDTEPEHVPPC
jgi:predicted O-methyltransferase YrrM